jgi:hypothetical protein
MTGRVAGELALMTGASSGLGAHLAKVMAAHGATGPSGSHQPGLTKGALYSCSRGAQANEEDWTARCLSAESRECAA